MHIVTDLWISAHSTKNGGWTKAQLAIVGVDWPPTQGWKERASGLLITPVEKEQFEEIGRTHG